MNRKHAGTGVLLAFLLLAVEGLPQSVQTDLKFERLSIAQGLSHSTVNCILQDHKGFVWFGTFDGLNRYDGHSFAVYKHNHQDSTSLGASGVWALYEDSASVLWVGTENGGLNRFDRATETFTRCQYDSNDSTSLSNNRVRAIYQDRAGILWIGTLGGGLNRFDRERWTFTRYQHNPDDPTTLSDNSVWCIYEDELALWIGTSKGLNRLVPSQAGGFVHTQAVFTHYRNAPNNPASLSHDMVMSIAADQSGALWIGTNGGGLNKFNRELGTFTRYQYDANNPNSLGGNAVFSIHPARKGGLQPMDVILSIDGIAVSQTNDVQALVASKKPGALITLKIFRNHRELTQRLVLGELPLATEQPLPTATRAPFKDLGISVANLTSADLLALKRARSGVKVTAVERFSPAEEAGLLTNDIILALNRQPVRGQEDFSRRLRTLKTGEAVILAVVREDALYHLFLEVL